MYMLEVAKEHQADAMAAAERGRLVSEVRHSRQHHGEGLWIIAAVRDLGRRLWDQTLLPSSKRDLGVAEGVAGHVTHSWDLAEHFVPDDEFRPTIGSLGSTSGYLFPVGATDTHPDRSDLDFILCVDRRLGPFHQTRTGSARNN